MFKGDSGGKEAIQAVIVGDHFGNEFRPVTDSLPFALLPLANIPLLEYTLEFLSLGGVDETYLICCNGGRIIEDYVERRVKNCAPWSRSMKVVIIMSETCRSFGDCLRDLDSRGLVRGNFILVEAGTIGSIDLKNYLQKHVNNCKNDKNAVATVLFENCGAGNPSALSKNEITLGASAKNRILFYQNKRSSKIEIPLDIISGNKTVDIFHNIKDVHVMICTSSVLPLFSDNFDFQTRDDFIRGLLMNEEIMGSTIYTEFIKNNEFGVGITDWRSYHATSIDVMHRWAYPMTPDAASAGLYRYIKNNIYRSQDVQIGKNVSLVEDVVIGPKSVVNSDTKITKSVIGPNVYIGKNVKIANSFIFNDVKIEDNVEITHSVIGRNSIVHSKSRITMGTILGIGVIIPTGTKLEDALVQSHDPLNKDPNAKIGPVAYKVRFDTDETAESGKESYSKATSRLHLHFPDEDESSEGDSTEQSEDLSYRNSPLPDDTNMFLTEVMDSLSRGYEDKLQCDNLILEINSSRYAYNVSLKEVNLNVVKAILELAFQNLPCKQSTGLQYWSTLQPLLKYFKPILNNYVRNRDAVEDALQAVEDVASSNSEIADCVVKVLEWFYDNDLMAEENILKWNSGLDKKGKLYKKVQPFISWLEEAEEDSDSDEED
ncbi:translation initiation factor eIF-2B subunit epsilon [Agrilus planipennis]|uniref:Translation initiation factor eIF2B subunit epsilon n=1 Tax=Agrilus planipennis TaxID=224129 RepID=A0A1W4WEE7_AGRPL|nr:translation initiation factor eIF-2B subunit epsilon [Agrilus planipennis]